jgi:hypothetical protein
MLMSEGKYHAALALAEELQAGGQDPMAGDTLATVRASIGDYCGAKEVMGEGRGADSKVLSASPLDEAEALDALEVIVELARDRQIVILNEAHHIPETRPLTLAVARELRKLGFSYLACEAFSPAITSYEKTGYPSQKNCSGYLAEPVFADLIRQAGNLGYRFVHYETENFAGPSGDRYDSINSREIDQSRHLIERIFAQDPDAKVLIHCGYSHATENWQELDDGRELAWMAARLGKELGLDPLTIDQTYQRQKLHPEQSSATWLYAVDQGWVEKPAVFRQTDGSFFVEGQWQGRVDLQVFHPQTEIEDGRPQWLSMAGYRKPVEIPVELEPAEGRVLIQAFVSDEGADAIPMDQVLWYAGDLSPVLMLPAGKYRVIARDDKGNEVGREECESAGES